MSEDISFGCKNAERLPNLKSPFFLAYWKYFFFTHFFFSDMKLASDNHACPQIMSKSKSKCYKTWRVNTQVFNVNTKCKQIHSDIKIGYNSCDKTGLFCWICRAAVHFESLCINKLWSYIVPIFLSAFMHYLYYYFFPHSFIH